MVHDQRESAMFSEGMGWDRANDVGGGGGGRGRRERAWLLLKQAFTIVMSSLPQLARRKRHGERRGKNVWRGRRRRKGRRRRSYDRRVAISTM
jgi:hypothetical protein